MELTIRFADKVLRRILLFLDGLDSILFRRVLQSREQIVFFHDTDQLVHNLPVLKEEKCRERLDRKRSLDLVDTRLVDANRRNLDVAIVFCDANERGNHD